MHFFSARESGRGIANGFGRSETLAWPVRVGCAPSNRPRRQNNVHRPGNCFNPTGPEAPLNAARRSRSVCARTRRTNIRAFRDDALVLAIDLGVYELPTYLVASAALLVSPVLVASAAALERARSSWTIHRSNTARSHPRAADCKYPFT